MMDPTLTITFSCLEEMLVITHKLRDIYTELAESPDVQGPEPASLALRNSCLEMAKHMDFVNRQTLSYLNFTVPDSSYGTC